MAVTEFVLDASSENPYRVGKELRPPLDGVWSARSGTYRVLHRIDEAAHEVLVLRIEHRRDAYG